MINFILGAATATLAYVLLTGVFIVGFKMGKKPMPPQDKQ